MKLLRQPEDSSLCGQTCVAMLAGVSLEESIKVFDTKGGTKTKQVLATLKHFGVKCGDLTRLKNGVKKSPICIVKLHFKDCDDTHWTVYNCGIYYDPDLGVVAGYPKEWVRETSFLPIELE
jgi:hypothetical protein